jgi:hypothetical protein
MANFLVIALFLLPVFFALNSIEEAVRCDRTALKGLFLLVGAVTLGLVIAVHLEG